MSNTNSGVLVRTLPKLVTLASCDFPIVESELNGFKVLTLPDRLRGLFMEEGAHVVRINSIALAQSLPDYGGKASGEHYSLLPHQDHLDNVQDRRRYLVLSKTTDGARDASTIIMRPDTAREVLSLEERFFKNKRRRAVLGRERCYDPRFLISEEQYHSCFDTDDGYEQVVCDVQAAHGAFSQELAVRLGLLGYLVRGPSADQVLRLLMRHHTAQFLMEPWETGGVVIIDNPNVFHARFGGNYPPLKRNFCI